MKPARIAVLIIGCLLLIPGLAITLGSAALTAAYSFGRDDGWFEVGLDRIQTPTAAVRSDELDLFSDPGSPDWLVEVVDLDIRLSANSVDDEVLFLGIGPAADVEAYLAGVAHDEIVEVDGGSPRYDRRSGAEAAEPPVAQNFWVELDVAVDPTLEWEADSGDWVAVLMRADGAPGFAADVDVGARSGLLLPLAIAGLAIGITMIAVGVVLIVVSTLGQSRTPAAASTPATAGVGEPVTSLEHPVALSAVIDPNLSRWQWLVKWILAIPHFIVLVFLWMAFVVATFAAGVAILFTGRYPHGLFEFNVGVLRWSYRVSYYASVGGIGTDQYPPFSLGREPQYPAVLDVAYPERLSRGLVLVKWWLLAIPHYLILGVLLGGAFAWGPGRGNWDVEPIGGGLLGLLVVITGVILLVTGRYPRSLFDLLMGLNRWIYRVIAYAALMTDRYPPFRLDQGGMEPGSPLPPPHGGGDEWHALASGPGDADTPGR